MTPALDVDGLTKVFGGRRGWLGGGVPPIRAVNDVTFSVAPGQTLGIVGESGCGKSTLARMIVGLQRPSGGAVTIGGRALSDLAAERAALGRSIQYVFQDPTSALNPRKTIRQILESPLIHLTDLDRPGRAARIDELLQAVGLRREVLARYPHEFSGGQAQRIAIARALAPSPRIVVLDEPVSALDVSVQAQVINLLEQLKASLNLTYLFISHDLAVVEAVCDRVAVLYFGRIVELADAAAIFNAPRHPYTRLLIRSAPTVAGKMECSQDTAELPDPAAPPPGCAFASRCPSAADDCRRSSPPLTQVSHDHRTACHHPLR